MRHAQLRGRHRSGRAVSRRPQSSRRKIQPWTLRLGDTAVSKSSSTLNAPPPKRPAALNLEQWEEARSVFPIYVAMAKQLQVQVPLAQAKRTLPEKPDAALLRDALDWFDAMDQRVLVHQLRHLLQTTTLNASESGLHVLIQRYLRKPSKTSTDRNKIDFLLVQY